MHTVPRQHPVSSNHLFTHYMNSGTIRIEKMQYGVFSNVEVTYRHSTNGSRGKLFRCSSTAEQSRTFRLLKERVKTMRIKDPDLTETQFNALFSPADLNG
jgi:hypothetical protein